MHKKRSPGLSQLKVLRALSLFGAATADQLTPLCFAPTSSKYCKQVLLELARAEYVWCEEMSIVLRATGRRGGHPYLYGLTREGIRAVEQAYRVALDQKPISLAERAFLRGHRHDMNVNDVLIAALTLAKEQPGITLERWEHARRLKEHLVGVPAVPDGYLRFVMRGQRHAIVLEVDESGKEEERRWKEKVGNLLVTMRSPLLANARAVEALNIAVVTAQGDGRRDRLRVWTREAAGEEADYFLFTSVLAADQTPHHFFAGTHWYFPGDPTPVALLDLSSAGVMDCPTSAV